MAHPFGCDIVHTLDLPAANKTHDNELMEFADREDRIVITKNSDYVDSHLISDTPKKLLLVSTGNISNRQLEVQFVAAIPTLLLEFATHAFLELGQAGVVIRG